MFITIIIIDELIKKKLGKDVQKYLTIFIYRSQENETKDCFWMNKIFCQTLEPYPDNNGTCSTQKTKTLIPTITINS